MPTMHLRLAIVILSTLALAACGVDAPQSEAATPTTPAGAETTTAAAPTRLPDDVVARLDSFLESLVYSDGTDPNATAPGVILLVDTPEGRYLNAAGVSSLEDGTPMRIDDRVAIGSNTKSMTIALLLQLQEEGALSLDDPLRVWLPEWAAKFPNGDRITLRQMARHTSGLWDYADPLIGAAVQDPAKLTEGYTPEELLQYAVDNGTPDFAPDEPGKWNYSNTGYVLLGLVIEKASGRPVGELFRTRIFEPLGLSTASFVEGVPTTRDVTVSGYWWTDDGTRLDTTKWNASQGWVAGAAAMTAEDLLTYAKALSAGRLFRDESSLSQMLTFNPDGMNGLLPYGLGVFDLGKLGAAGSWGHEGQTAGAQTLWFTNPETGVTVVGLSNSATFSGFAFTGVVGVLEE